MDRQRNSALGPSGLAEDERHIWSGYHVVECMQDWSMILMSTVQAFLCGQDVLCELTLQYLSLEGNFTSLQSVDLLMAVIS
jgi:hypothetical protein